MSDAAVAPPKGSIGLTTEAAGTLVTCKRCGWIQWNETKAASRQAGVDHKCRAADLVPPGRRYPPPKKRKWS